MYLHDNIIQKGVDIVEEYNILQRILENIQKVIVGKENVIEKVLICLISGGHILVEDVPGVGKTMLVHALSKSIDCDFKRIQFTPDLLPSDIIGVSIYNPRSSEFEFKPGPIFSQIILADEINRTSPKSQSSLLEAMEEHQITEGGKTYKLKEPFMVLATQNPIEYEGTFPLPEAQLDRFMMKINIGYPEENYEIEMLRRFKKDAPLQRITPVSKPEEIMEIRKKVSEVFIDEKVEKYLVSIVRATRNREDIILGASPRATLNLYKACQGRAFIRNRDFVTPDDVKSMVKPILSHRIILKPEYRLREVSTENVLDKILGLINIPGAGLYV